MQRPVYQLSISECQIELGNLTREIENDTDAVNRHIASLENVICTTELNSTVYDKCRQLAGDRELLRLLPRRHEPKRERMNSLNLRIIEASTHNPKTV
jgi:hypothetical protein